MISKNGGNVISRVTFSGDICGILTLETTEKGSEGMKQFVENGKIGFTDSWDQVILEAQFDAVDTFYDPNYWWCEYGEYYKGGHPGIGYEIAVQKDGKWGLINQRKAQWITPCQWEAVGYFKYGCAEVKRDGKWGFIDTEGKLVIPCRWDEVGSFTWEGGAKVKLDGKYGYVDKEGNALLRCEWDALDRYDAQWMNVKRDGRWYVRDSEGNLFTPGEGKGKLVFHQGFAEVYDGSGHGLIDREGREVIACQWDEIERVPQNVSGYPWKRNDFIRLWANRTEYPYKLIKVKKNGKWGIYDLNGKECHPCTLDKIWRIGQGVAKICQDKKWGLIDENGRIITSCQWEYVDYFRGEEAAVRLNKHWGTIDRKGNPVRPCTHFVGLWRNE